MTHHRGIAGFHLTFLKDNQGGRHSNAEEIPDNDWIWKNLDMGHKVVTARGDGETVTVFIRAFDVLGNAKVWQIP